MSFSHLVEGVILHLIVLYLIWSESEGPSGCIGSAPMQGWVAHTSAEFVQTNEKVWTAAENSLSLGQLVAWEQERPVTH